jgi:hypothetical protein
MAEQELTRGQKAAKTRAANKRRRARSGPITEMGRFTVVELSNFLSSIDDIEEQVYGDVQAGTTIVSKIGLDNVTARYDGEQWTLDL